jgi:transcription initiation factor TFIIE subunit alpha
MDFIRGIFVCEICQHELVENEDAESVQGSKDRMMRFNHQMRFIREGLQKSETMTLPQFDVAAWVKSHAQAELEQKQKMANGGVGGGGENGMNGVGVGLKVAGADSNGKREEGIGILMVMDGDGDDEDKRRREREKEAEQKRAQNALPSWHLKSTITGDLTALGVKESARAAAAAQAREHLGLGDESLRGLGVAGLPKSRHASSSSLSLPIASSLKPEDASSTADQEAELYEQYYANLAANSSYSGSTPVSTTATPSATVPSEYGVDIDEEEDRKPTIQYLDSLSEYRKRSRSIDDVGTGGPRTPKIAKTDSSSSLGGLTNGFGNVSVEYPSSSFLSAYEEPPPPSQSAGGDPLVYGEFFSCPHA